MIWKNSQLRTYLFLGVIVTSIILAAIALSPPGKGYTYDLKTFSSYDDLLDFLNERYENYNEYGWYGGGDPRMALEDDSVKESSRESNAAGGTSVDFSQTNIQVEGVDEPDIVKTDGTYLYIVAGSKIVIVKAYPADQAVVLSEISLDDSQNPVNIFINEDRLVVFSESYETYQSDDIEYMYGWWGVSKTVITVYDVSDREHPKVDKEIKVDGSYVDSRMIGEYVYVIISEYSSDIYRNVDDNITLCIPEITIDGETEQIPADQIYYIDVPELSDTMTHVLSINIYDGDVNQKSFMLGSSQSMYVSKNNIFLAYLHYEYIYPLLESQPGENIQTTILHKISIDAEDISYAAQGEVPGMILNQFSMDEHDGYFRIATTIGSLWSDESTNNIYILDENLKRVSEIEDIAPGERIYSARFMGSKAYLVTFKKIDPFFTIDLSDPKNPQILGELKIPGYSDYLHPYDENHI
ncbi:MAG: beta-propeller domain-containing protein, partial [Thermoplasmatales archaeon]|nr:beta-propeller domain-containing protein [Thermoplasmatales archaeon]